MPYRNIISVYLMISQLPPLYSFLEILNMKLFNFAKGQGARKELSTILSAGKEFRLNLNKNPMLCYSFFKVLNFK